jgi:hypothetical protein
MDAFTLCCVHLYRNGIPVLKILSGKIIPVTHLGTWLSVTAGAACGLSTDSVNLCC